MATTSLWRVKGYLKTALMYVQNPDKVSNPTVIQVPEGADPNSLGDLIAYAARESATNNRELVWGMPVAQTVYSGSKNVANGLIIRQNPLQEWLYSLTGISKEILGRKMVAQIILVSLRGWRMV